LLKGAVTGTVESVKNKESSKILGKDRVYWQLECTGERPTPEYGQCFSNLRQFLPGRLLSSDDQVCGVPNSASGVLGLCVGHVAIAVHTKNSS
jgi:hypothetical protein